MGEVESGTGGSNRCDFGEGDLELLQTVRGAVIHWFYEVVFVGTRLAWTVLGKEAYEVHVVGLVTNELRGAELIASFQGRGLGTADRLSSSIGVQRRPLLRNDGGKTGGLCTSTAALLDDVVASTSGHLEEVASNGFEFQFLVCRFGGGLHITARCIGAVAVTVQGTVEPLGKLFHIGFVRYGITDRCTTKLHSVVVSLHWWLEEWVVRHPYSAG